LDCFFLSFHSSLFFRSSSVGGDGAFNFSKPSIAFFLDVEIVLLFFGEVTTLFVIAVVLEFVEAYGLNLVFVTEFGLERIRSNSASIADRLDILGMFKKCCLWVELLLCITR